MGAVQGIRERAQFGCALSFLFVVCIMAFLGSTSADAGMRKDRLTVVTETGRHEFAIEVAETEADKALGLMYRTSLDRRAGMLFAYKKPFEITMWMKNTYISLDMIFIRPDGIVHRIARRTEPFSEAVIASRGDVSAVLEVIAGVADEIGLKPGDRIEHAVFGTKK